MTTNLDILDTAIKVGLGALLGGYFSFATQAFVQDRTRDREKNKELRDRLYALTTKFGKSFESVTHYIASAVVFNNNPKDPTSKSEYEEADRENLASWKGLLGTPFELEILGLKKSAALATAYFIHLSDSANMVSEIIELGQESKRNNMNDAFETLMKSIKDDYQSLF